jgi:hypothetical protein
MLSAVGSPELARDAHVGAIAPPIGRDDARRRAFGIGAVSLACVGSPGWVLTSTIASDIAEYQGERPLSGDAARRDPLAIRSRDVCVCCRASEHLSGQCLP